LICKENKSEERRKVLVKKNKSPLKHRGFWSAEERTSGVAKRN